MPIDQSWPSYIGNLAIAMGLLTSVDLILLIAIKELSPGFESALKRAKAINISQLKSETGFQKFPTGCCGH